MHALLHSLAFHRRAIAAVVGELESQRIATWARSIIETLEAHPDALAAGLSVERGVVQVAGTVEPVAERSKALADGRHGSGPKRRKAGGVA